MSCFNFIPDPPSCVDLYFNHEEAINRVLDESIESRKVLKKIYKQFQVTEVSYSGSAWFDEFGNLEIEKPENSFKYRVVYLDYETRNKHVWCFN